MARRQRKSTTFSTDDLNKIADLAGIKGNLTKDVLDNLKRQLGTIQTHTQPQQPIYNSFYTPLRATSDRDRLFRQPEPPPPLDEEGRFEQAWRALSMNSSWRSSIKNLSGKEVAKVWLDSGKGKLCAKFPYKQSVIDEIRSKIPKGKKIWNDSDKLWEFSCETIEMVIEILTNGFGADVLDLTEATAPILSGPISSDPLLSLLDADDITKIYKQLAMKYHPDRQGGDGDKMAKINQLFAKRNGGK